jgi:hypothetical protein
MAFNHRSVYSSDVGLFVLLATPLLNEFVIEFILSFGSGDFYRGDAKSAINAFVGIAGVLGLGFSLLRLKIADSRLVASISFFVKAAAAAWLFSAYLYGLSPVFLALAAADFLSALVLLKAVVAKT